MQRWKLKALNQLSLYHNGQLTINDWNYLLNSIKSITEVKCHFNVD